MRDDDSDEQRRRERWSEATLAAAKAMPCVGDLDDPEREATLDELEEWLAAIRPRFHRRE